MSYKAIPKEAPNITVAGLVLIQIKLHLKKFGFLRLQKTGYFVNYFLGEEYFTFTKFYYGPYSHSIMEYFWVTHETDSFLYHLSQESR